jgi:hypothetical protein
VLSRLVWVACIVRPGVHLGSGWVAAQLEHLDYALPNSLAAKHFFHWHAFNVGRICAV